MATVGPFIGNFTNSHPLWTLFALRQLQNNAGSADPSGVLGKALTATPAARAKIAQLFDDYAASTGDGAGSILTIIQALIADLPAIIQAVQAILALFSTATPAHATGSPLHLGSAPSGRASLPAIALMFVSSVMLWGSWIFAQPPKLAGPQPAQVVHKHLTGAKPSPRHKLLSTPRHATRATPAYYGVVSSKYSYWLNDQDGDCVTAEECANIDTTSVVTGAPGAPVIIADAEVQSWARQNGFLNGANLTDVMDALQVSQNNGLTTTAGLTYFDGPYTAVDWTNRANLCSAIYQGQVKIGVASSQLLNVVGQSNGWVLTGASVDQDEDHCVGLVGFGTASQLFGILGMAPPSGLDGTTFGYLLFTWSTVGFIDEPSMQNITGEAWLRSPSSIVPGQVGTPPQFTSSATFPPATVGTPFTCTVTASGSPAPTFAVTQGALPSGISSTGAGLFSGTPTTAGGNAFTITATNSAGSATQDATLLVSSGPTPPGPTPTGNYATFATQVNSGTTLLLIDPTVDVPVKIADWNAVNAQLTSTLALLAAYDPTPPDPLPPLPTSAEGRGQKAEGSAPKRPNEELPQAPKTRPKAKPQAGAPDVWIVAVYDSRASNLSVSQTTMIDDAAFWTKLAPVHGYVLDVAQSPEGSAFVSYLQKKGATLPALLLEETIAGKTNVMTLMPLPFDETAVAAVAAPYQIPVR